MNDDIYTCPDHPASLPEPPSVLEEHDVSLVYGDDWEGLYLDGLLIREGHSLDVRDVLEALGITVDYVMADDCLNELGSCPPLLTEVVPDEEEEED
jgi:hypothetical protein